MLPYYGSMHLVQYLYSLYSKQAYTLRYASYYIDLHVHESCMRVAVRVLYGGREGHYPWYTSTPTRKHLYRRTFSDAWTSLPMLVFLTRELWWPRRTLSMVHCHIDPPTYVSRRVNSHPDVRFPTREPLSRRAFRARRMKLFLVRHAISRRSFPALYFSTLALSEVWFKLSMCVYLPKRTAICKCQYSKQSTVRIIICLGGWQWSPKLSLHIWEPSKWLSLK